LNGTEDCGRGCDTDAAAEDAGLSYYALCNSWISQQLRIVPESGGLTLISNLCFNHGTQ